MEPAANSPSWSPVWQRSGNPGTPPASRDQGNSSLPPDSSATLAACSSWYDGLAKDPQPDQLRATVSWCLEILSKGGPNVKDGTVDEKGHAEDDKEQEQGSHVETPSIKQTKWTKKLVDCTEGEAWKALQVKVGQNLESAVLVEVAELLVQTLKHSLHENHDGMDTSNGAPHNSYIVINAVHKGRPDHPWLVRECLASALSPDDQGQCLDWVAVHVASSLPESALGVLIEGLLPKDWQVQGVDLQKGAANFSRFRPSENGETKGSETEWLQPVAIRAPVLDCLASTVQDPLISVLLSLLKARQALEDSTESQVLTFLILALSVACPQALQAFLEKQSSFITAAALQTSLSLTQSKDNQFDPPGELLEAFGLKPEGPAVLQWLQLLVRSRLRQLAPVGAKTVLLLDDLACQEEPPGGMSLVSCASRLLRELVAGLWKEGTTSALGMNKQLDKRARSDTPPSSKSFRLDDLLSFLHALTQQTPLLWRRLVHLIQRKPELKKGPSRPPLLDLIELLNGCCSIDTLSDRLVSLTVIGIHQPSLQVAWLTLQALAGWGRGGLVLNSWGCKLAEHVNELSALRGTMALLRKVGSPEALDTHTAQACVDLDYTFTRSALAAALHGSLDKQWVRIFSHLHTTAGPTRQALLSLLQALKPWPPPRGLILGPRIETALGLLFHVLDQSLSQPQDIAFLQQLKRLIAQLVCDCDDGVMLLCSHVLDYSFDLCSRLGIGGPAFSALSNGRLGEWGTLELPKGGAEQKEEVLVYEPLLPENRKRKLGPIQPSTEEPLLVQLGRYPCKPPLKAPPMNTSSPQDSLSLKRVTLELAHLVRLGLTARDKILEGGEGGASVKVLARLLMDRLETPHEAAATVQQYEEVLPKRVPWPRHTFLVHCCTQNPLLLELLAMVAELDGPVELLRCSEVVRALLADTVSRWHDPVRPPPGAKATRSDQAERTHASRIVNMISAAGWLPPPLSSSSELIGVIDPADMPDLLFLIWRCAHHAMACGGQPAAFTVRYPTPPPSTPQGKGEPHGGKAEATGETMKEEEPSEAPLSPKSAAVESGVYPEPDWEGHFFAILRHNIDKLGCQFASLWPPPPKETPKQQQEEQLGLS